VIFLLWLFLNWPPAWWPFGHNRPQQTSSEQTDESSGDEPSVAQQIETNYEKKIQEQLTEAEENHPYVYPEVFNAIKSDLDALKKETIEADSFPADFQHLQDDIQSLNFAIAFDKRTRRI